MDIQEVAHMVENAGFGVRKVYSIDKEIVFYTSSKFFDICAHVRALDGGIWIVHDNGFVHKSRCDEQEKAFFFGLNHVFAEGSRLAIQCSVASSIPTAVARIVGIVAMARACVPKEFNPSEMETWVKEIREENPDQDLRIITDGGGRNFALSIFGAGRRVGMHKAEMSVGARLGKILDEKRELLDRTQVEIDALGTLLNFYKEGT